MGKVIITGVGGNFGAYTARSIMHKMNKEDLIFTSANRAALQIYAEEGVMTRFADFNDAKQLPEAFAGGETLLLISLPFVGPKRRQLHKHAIDGAKAAGVKKIIYVSVVGAGDPENKSLVKIDHEYTENYIKEVGGMDYIFMRDAQYTEAMISQFEQSVAMGGLLRNNMGDGKMAFVSRNDCAEAAACLAAGAGQPNSIYHITGPELLSIAEFMAIGTTITGHEVRYEYINEEEMYRTFDAMGVPRTTDGDFSKSAWPFCSDDMVSFGKAIHDHKMNIFTEDFKRLTGKKPLSVREIFKHLEDYRLGQRNATE
ncbi:NmrA family transcriptional regulator [Paenibacillus sp. CAA11]|uniref:NAD(P)H-binding protein n=1 Tax=Paenibacillus sp. CAA11 TaxID=1532905 RepID=UPI000D3B8EE4|nr:NAD(P)H-binding protein [Paenibacillus sp. CAA11]AWB46547.1 NmrA family transcriptional regulator [Paenibacillus sp. CAA11]